MMSTIILRCVEAAVQATRVVERNPGDHYRNKGNAAKVYSAALEVLRAERVEALTVRSTILVLEDRLEQARYTGD